ncbi:hypothetical protein IMSHALPRED_004728 [Imshaugia aleurites]|uniref:Uncharacterized protein n=1 Tax=Imshaugia aleurites TaxID=172621 RepID=A0A8H3FD41_9LECA|nr:hypothetical protein IMSHALPRED_004728 [Imshaugia aleurites]
MPADKISNREALNKREKKDYGTWCADVTGSSVPKRWAGTVMEDFGKNEHSGMWRIKINAPALVDPVKAWVNETRQVGAPVQFCLLDTDEKEAVTTWFETSKGERNHEWRDGMDGWHGWDASTQGNTSG